MLKKSFQEKLISYTDSELSNLYRKLLIHEHIGFDYSSWKLEFISIELGHRDIDIDNILDNSIAEIQRIDDILYESNLKEYYPMVAEKKAIYDIGVELFDDLAESAMLDMQNLIYDEKTLYFYVSGDSMIDAQLFDGDILIVTPCREPKHNRVVVAMLDGKRYVKRYYRRDGDIRLKSDNPKYKDWVIKPWSDFQIIGIVVGKYQTIK